MLIKLLLFGLIDHIDFLTHCLSTFYFGDSLEIKMDEKYKEFHSDCFFLRNGYHIEIIGRKKL